MKTLRGKLPKGAFPLGYVKIGRLRIKTMSARWLRENRYNIALKFTAFLINPLLAFYFSLIRLKTKSSFIILFLVFMSFGMSMTVPRVRTENMNFDGIAYRNDFESYDKVTLHSFVMNFKDYLLLEGQTDFYADTIYFFVSRFSENYHVMFLFVAFFFSIFSLKSLKIFIQEEHYENSLVCFILLYTFLINQILNINAFRFFTASWIATYAILKILVLKERKCLMWVLLAPFFHGAFWALSLLLLVNFLFGKYIKICAVLFVASFFFAELSVELLRNNVDFLPLALGQRLQVYLNEGYMEQINEGGSGLIWIKRMVETLTRVYFNFIVIFFVFKYHERVEYSKCKTLFSFLLILMIFINLTMIIPSVGSRFLILALPIIAYIGLVCFIDSQYKLLFYGLACIWVLHLLLPFSIYLFPCMHYYSVLWEGFFFMNSPLLSFVKYILLF